MLEKSKWRVWSSDFTCEPMLLDEMTRRLVQEFQPEQVILFGSHAWGTPNQDSDIDLMVIVQEAFESDYERMVRGYRCLSGINIPKDIIVKTKAEFDSFCSVRASLEYKIGREGKVLYERRQIDCDARQNRDAYQNVRCCSSGCRLDGTNGLSTPKPHLPPTVELGLQD